MDLLHEVAVGQRFFLSANSDVKETPVSEKARNPHETIADWIGDIVALESHVEEAMDKQLSLESKDEKVAMSFKRYHDAVRDSKRRAVAYQESYGSTAGNPVIAAGTALLGKAAGIIDKLRADGASKALRDDYTAYNQVAIAYSMLLTTALGYGDDATADFANEGLTTYAGLVQDLNHIIPAAVIADLQQNNSEFSPQPTAIETAIKRADAAWKSTTQS
jgi:ferritin-like metal-binding protein YciE